MVLAPLSLAAALVGSVVRITGELNFLPFSLPSTLAILLSAVGLVLHLDRKKNSETQGQGSRRNLHAQMNEEIGRIVNARVLGRSGRRA
jgi:hypothetical protein